MKNSGLIFRGRDAMRSGLLAGLMAGVLALPALGGPVQASLSVKGKRLDDVKNTSRREGSYYEQQTTTYKTSGTSAMAIDMSVRNMGKEPQTLQLDWFFIGKPLDPKQPDFVADRGTKSVTVASGTLVTEKAESKPLKFDKQTGRNVKIREGAEVGGYLVLLKSGTNVVAVDASSQTLKKLAADEKKLKELTDESEPAEKKKK